MIESFKLIRVFIKQYKYTKHDYKRVLGGLSKKDGFTIICNKCGCISQCNITEYNQFVGNLFEVGNNGIRCLECDNDKNLIGD